MTTPSKKPASDGDQQEQPQRSRNARAQARHRAKRKAYIEQLEETVTKLQSALNLTPEQVAALPSAQVRIRELEQETLRLRNENNALRMQIDHLARGGVAHSRREPISPFDDMDRDKKRRRLSGEVDNVYLTPGGTPTQNNNSGLSRPPPPLSLPHPHQVSYGHSNGAGGTGLGSASSLFNGYQGPGPGTPTASSSSSTPSYSATSQLPPVVDPARGKTLSLRASSLDPSDAVRSLQHPPQGSNHTSHSHSQSHTNHSHSSHSNHAMHLPPPIPSQYNHSLPPFSHSYHDSVPKSEDDYPLVRLPAYILPQVSV